MRAIGLYYYSPIGLLAFREAFATIPKKKTVQKLFLNLPNKSGNIFICYSFLFSYHSRVACLIYLIKFGGQNERTNSDTDLL